VTPAHSLDEHRELIEAYLKRIVFKRELGVVDGVMRYALSGGGKRIRPVLCLATGEAAGGDPEELLIAAAAVELVHTFSLVHDDLPALDDDAVRRGQPTVHAEFGEATAVLAGDALLAQAFDLALTLPMVEPARELADATLGMISGQYRDVKERGDLLELYELKTGRLFEAAVACGLWVARMPVGDQGPWRMFGKQFGLLFQILDDIADGDGVVGELGRDDAHALAMKTEARARRWFDEIDADTSLLDELLSGLKHRASLEGTSGSSLA
jgi:geranylgeranyl diphosphate synthase type II